MSQVSNQMAIRVSRSTRICRKRSDTDAGAMLNQVSIGVSAIPAATNAMLPAVTSLAAAFQLLNAKRANTDTDRHANMALREIVVTSAANPAPMAAHATKRIFAPRNRP